jgi:hypothetical protein
MDEFKAMSVYKVVVGMFIAWLVLFGVPYPHVTHNLWFKFSLAVLIVPALFLDDMSLAVMLFAALVIITLMKDVKGLFEGGQHKSKKKVSWGGVDQLDSPYASADSIGEPILETFEQEHEQSQQESQQPSCQRGGPVPFTQPTTGPPLIEKRCQDTPDYCHTSIDEDEYSLLSVADIPKESLVRVSEDRILKQGEYDDLDGYAPALAPNPSELFAPV